MCSLLVVNLSAKVSTKQPKVSERKQQLLSLITYQPQLYTTAFALLGICTYCNVPLATLISALQAHCIAQYKSTHDTYKAI